MKICDKCRKSNYRNLISPFQVFGKCDLCSTEANCNEHPEWALIKDSDIIKEDVKNYTMRAV